VEVFFFARLLAETGIIFRQPVNSFYNIAKMTILIIQAANKEKIGLKTLGGDISEILRIYIHSYDH